MYTVFFGGSITVNVYPLGDLGGNFYGTGYQQ